MTRRYFGAWEVTRRYFVAGAAEAGSRFSAGSDLRFDPVLGSARSEALTSSRRRKGRIK